MTNEKIARINELARKSKTTGLTEAEKAEQQGPLYPFQKTAFSAHFARDTPPWESCTALSSSHNSTSIV